MVASSARSDFEFAFTANTNWDTVTAADNAIIKTSDLTTGVQGNHPHTSSVAAIEEEDGDEASTMAACARLGRELAMCFFFDPSAAPVAADDESIGVVSVTAMVLEQINNALCLSDDLLVLLLLSFIYNMMIQLTVFGMAYLFGQTPQKMSNVK